jgi:HEAT repeat protein
MSAISIFAADGPSVGRVRRRQARRRTRYAISLAGLDGREQSALAARAGRSASALSDLAVEVDRVWAGMTLSDRDLLRYHLRAAGIPATLRRTTRSWSARRRARAAATIGLLRLDECTADLGRLLHDHRRRVSMTAAWSLARVATPESARVLIAALEQGLLPEQRLVEALGGPWAAGPLLAAFRAPRTVALRVPLADALGRAGSVEAVETFATAMPAAGTDLRVRMVRSLTRIGTPDAVVIVRGALHDREWPVRAQAAWSLARLGDTGGIDLLRDGLVDRSPRVRANCAAALRRLATMRS